MFQQKGIVSKKQLIKLNIENQYRLFPFFPSRKLKKETKSCWCFLWVWVMWHLQPGQSSFLFTQPFNWLLPGELDNKYLFKHVFRISLETLDADLQWLTSRTRSLEENVQKDTELLQQLDSFLEVIRTNTHQCGELIINHLTLPAKSDATFCRQKSGILQALAGISDALAIFK